MLPIDSVPAPRSEVNPQDPATWLKPDETLIGADGRDWSWAYVIFADVPRYPGYKAGTNGTVWSRRWSMNGRVHELSDAWHPVKRMPRKRTGYLRVSLCVAGIQDDRQVHHVILETFVGPCPPGLEARHLNGIKIENRLSNLCWGTHLDNNRDRIRHGTIPRGETCHNAKITESTIATIYELRRQGLYQAQIGERVGLTQAVISKILRGDLWKHVPRPE